MAETRGSPTSYYGDSPTVKGVVGLPIECRRGRGQRKYLNPMSLEHKREHDEEFADSSSVSLGQGPDSSFLMGSQEAWLAGLWTTFE